MKVIEEDKSTKMLTLWAVTMIDPATGWFELKQIDNKEPGTVANAVEQAWLTRYPWPSIIVYDNGTEFLKEFAEMIKDDYGIEKKGTTVRNPQANSILERIHQTLWSIL
jgi:transposase InsO family protein